uniref:Putative ovule protein n=1 Tax=Solanum chacoense TaxID=4108 RepID=A0A0V0HHB9_SOLCH
MTNDDLLILSRNCMNLTELSLVGCKRLNSESQDTISNGWPGLISLHLEVRRCYFHSSCCILELLSCFS